MQAKLEAIIGRFGADTGTIHLLENGVLMLKAHAGVPDTVVRIVERVPIGKGMDVASRTTQNLGGARARSNDLACRLPLRALNVLEASLRSYPSAVRECCSNMWCFRRRDGGFDL